MNFRKYALVSMLIVVLTSFRAYAFPTVIDVQEKSGNIVTIQQADDYSYSKLRQLSASYRGDSIQAIYLFEAIAAKELPAQITSYDYEVNADTGTISIIISSQGIDGLEYSYFVLPLSGN